MSVRPLSRLQVFSTCPQSKHHSADEYARHVVEVARWSENHGFAGILVYSDNSLTDPWTVSSHILENTDCIAPLVAVQPVYMHPYMAATKVASLAHLYQRRVYLNMIAGGFKNDLLALNDQTPHDDRYVRLVEYTQIVMDLLREKRAVTFEGKYYKVENLTLGPDMPSELLPGVLVSGSSNAGEQAALSLGATAVKYPRRPTDEAAQTDRIAENTGIRVGVIARENTEQAWQVAHSRFPDDRRGQLLHQMAMKVSDSQWHQQLTEVADETRSYDDPYWLGPFRNYQTFCPYLVGSYEQVGQELSRYIELGNHTFILDIPPDQEELQHTAIAFSEALEMSPSCNS